MVEGEKNEKPSLWVNIKDSVAGFFGLRQTRHGINFGILLIGVFGIIVVVNVIASKKVIQFDMTAKKNYSLSDKTVQVLTQRLKDQDVKILGFFATSDETGGKQTTKELITSYRRYDDRISIDFIDPELDPIKANKFNIDRFGEVVISIGDKNETVTTLNEETVTNALIKLTTTTSKKICFVSGHGEFSLENEYQSAKTALESDNYTTESIILLGKSAVPTDCNALIISSGKTEPSKEETLLIQTYLNGNGKAMFLLDALEKNAYGTLLAEWGITVGNDVVLDLGQAVGSAFTPIFMTYSSNQIVAKLTNNPIVLHTARSVDQAETPPTGISAEWLVKSSSKSWAETDLSDKGLENPVFDDKVDKKGPISVAVAASGSKTQAAATGQKKEETRIVVVGDTHFLSKEVLGQVAGNKDFFLNSINWIAEQEDLISISPKDAQTDPIVLSTNQKNIILFISIIFIPLIVIIFGIGIWVKRRKSR
ncbi:MAG: GldG family protein [bacterium]